MTSYVNPFTGQTISPAQSSYTSFRIPVPAAATLEWPINGNDTGYIASDIMDLEAFYGDTIYLPSAEQVSTGQTLLIRNVGTLNIYVRDFGQFGLVTTIAAGTAQFIYLTNNSSPEGQWTSVVFGAGTSIANAASLAAANGTLGIVAVGTNLGQAYPVSSLFSTYTVDAYADRARFLNWASGVDTIELPSAATVGDNWFCMIRNSGTGILTVMPDGTDTIDGAATLDLQLAESITLVSDGTNWVTFGIGRSNQFAYTILSLSVTGGTLILSATQAANTIQEYSGVLTSNQIIQVPSTVQLYTVTNNTSGAYILTVKTSTLGAAYVDVPQGESLVLICDGTNVYNAASGASSSTVTSLTVGNGTLAVPSIKFFGDLNTGFYLPLSNRLGIVVNNTEVAYFDATTLQVVGEVNAVGGISGGTF